MQPNKHVYDKNSDERITQQALSFYKAQRIKKHHEINRKHKNKKNHKNSRRGRQNKRFLDLNPEIYNKVFIDDTHNLSHDEK